MVNKHQTKNKTRSQKVKISWRRIRKNKSFVKICILIIFINLQLSCQPEPKECAEFFSTDSTQRLKEFPKYDLEKQLIIHRCGLDWHPRYDYSYEIAERGKTIIPTLLQKLNNDNYKSIRGLEKTKYGIILIFQRLAENGDLNNNKEVLKILEQTVSEMRANWIKEASEKSLAEIKKDVGE